MNRKEFIEWIEKIRSEAVRRMEKRKQEGDADSMNYQLGKAVLCRTVIAKLEEQEDGEE